MTTDYLKSLIKGKTSEEILLLGKNYANTFFLDMREYHQDYLRVGFHILGIPMKLLPPPLPLVCFGCYVWEKNWSIVPGESVIWEDETVYLSVFDDELEKIQ